jgi:hypothetical protein
MPTICESLLSDAAIVRLRQENPKAIELCRIFSKRRASGTRIAGMSFAREARVIFSLESPI